MRVQVNLLVIESFDRQRIDLPSYKVDCKQPVCEAFCSPSAVDEYDRRLRALRLGD